MAMDNMHTKYQHFMKWEQIGYIPNDLPSQILNYINLWFNAEYATPGGKTPRPAWPTLL